ncbi:c-type cytochrome [Terrimonas alba]|uniref:c-type cytochrome n=1 Tax=Terrimonas alba TaxID=3349636 RepID=UPI0035F35DC2
MKRIFVTVITLATLASCGGGNTEKKDTATESKEEKAAPAETPISEHPDYQAGLALIAKSDCLTCHKVDEKLTGPAYREVANKYASEGSDIVPKLAEKIIKGGVGVWGQVPMTAHPTLSQADAEQMVKYILLLKN